MNTLIKAAGVEVEPIWPMLFSRALEGVCVSDKKQKLSKLCV